MSSKFMIGPIPEGLRKDVKPWAIVENAFASLTNAYQWRGRLVRRPGYTLLGRLNTMTNLPVMGLKTRELFGLGLQQQIAFDTTSAYTFDAGLSAFIPLPSVMATTWSGTNYQFFNTANYAGGFWATNGKAGLHGLAILDIDNANPAKVTTTVPHGYSTGQFVAIINVSGYEPIPASPPTPILNGQVFKITFDGVDTFTLDGFDGSLYNAYTSGGMVLNAQVNIAGEDGIRYYGELSTGTSWANYNPPIDPNTALAGALAIFPYRGYLVFLSTIEGNEDGVQEFQNRARWTQIGTPYYSEPVPTVPNKQFADPKAARDDLFGRGGANDAPTSEVIVGAAFIRDVLIVCFSRSTWRLRFVNNAQNPFVWERVNVELGSSCPYSLIPFDKGVMALGNRGIVISDGNDTIRIDEKIPDDVFSMRQSENGLNRVNGIRTFKTRLAYWTFPDESNGSGIFPDKVLVYNYETQNWAYFDDCFTCFGYFYPTTSNLGYRWHDLPDPWPTYDNITCEVDQNNAGREIVLAGNQQGFVFQLETDSAQNDPSLYISAIAGDIISSPDNNLPTGSWIKITSLSGTTSADGVSLNGRNFKTVNVNNDPDDFTLQEYEPIIAGNAIGAAFPTTGTYSINYTPIYKGSVQINVGTIVFTDPELDGNLTSNVANTIGTINYSTGQLSLSFNPPLGVATAVNIRLVSIDPEQSLVPVNLTGVYGGDGLITKISNVNIQSKIFNFFKDDAGTRLSKIDFYMNLTDRGQFTCNVLGDSSTVPVNAPLSANLQSNVVLTSKNPYQVGSGEETIFRLFCDASCQTVQLQLEMTDKQMAVDEINNSDIELLALMFTMSSKGRLV